MKFGSFIVTFVCVFCCAFAQRYYDISKITNDGIITAGTYSVDTQQIGQNVIIRRQLFIDSITDVKPYYIIYGTGDSARYKIASKFDSTKCINNLSEIKVGDNVLLELTKIYPIDSTDSVAVMRNLGIGLGFGPFYLKLEQESGYKIYTATNLNGLYRTSSSSDNDKVQTIPSVTITSPQVNTMIEFAISHAQEYYPQCCNLVVSPKDYSIVITSYNQNNTAYFNVSFLTEEYLNKMDPFMGYTTYNNYTIYCDTGSYFVKDEKSKSLTIEQIDYTESNSRIIDFVSYRFKLSNDSICWLNAPVAMSDN